MKLFIFNYRNIIGTALLFRMNKNLIKVYFQSNYFGNYWKFDGASKCKIEFLATDERFGETFFSGGLLVDEIRDVLQLSLRRLGDITVTTEKCGSLSGVLFNFGINALKKSKIPEPKSKIWMDQLGFVISKKLEEYGYSLTNVVGVGEHGLGYYFTEEKKVLNELLQSG
eukprot:maker-scaffold_2-snap-gene-17.55-mRNA-1 protein AED:0.04 eAED:0.04 QI:5/0/0.5/1/0/0/2/0/168